MSATAAEIAQVRRMVAEPTEAIYDDDAIQTYIETYPLVDENGEPPRVPSSTSPGEMEDNDEWTATYDLHAAAAAIWEEKASNYAADFDFTADGGSYRRSQVMDNMLKKARYHTARRSLKTITLVPNIVREQDDDLTN